MVAPDLVSTVDDDLSSHAAAVGRKRVGWDLSPRPSRISWGDASPRSFAGGCATARGN